MKNNSKILTENGPMLINKILTENGYIEFYEYVNKSQIQILTYVKEKLISITIVDNKSFAIISQKF